MQAGIYPEVPDDFGHWLAGFIDGEGCFVIERRNRSGYACRFSVGLRDDDEPILKEIAVRLGMGTIRYDAQAARGGRRGQARLTITAKYDCMQLVRLLDRFPLRAKKARDYAIWREAAVYLSGRRHWAHVGWGPMPRLMQDLKDIRSYEQPPPRPEPASPLSLWDDTSQ